MRKTVCLVVMAVCCALLSFCPLLAQEPAFNSNNSQVLRFEESPGFYHYLYPCRSSKEFHATPPKIDYLDPTLEPALCWMVSAFEMTNVNGKFAPAGDGALQGMLTISEHRVRFTPGDTTKAARYSDLSSAETHYEHKAGDSFAFFGDKTVFYKFAFTNVCATCVANAQVPAAANPQQLETELELVHASLAHFADTYARVKDETAGVRIQIAANNQPAASDRKEAFALYGELDRKLADECPEPAKACFARFAGYLADCAADPASAGCQKAPECTASCNLTAAKSKQLPAMYCIEPGEDSAVAVPDLSGIVAADPGLGKPPHKFEQGTVDFSLTVKKTGPGHSEACGVKGSLTRARMPDTRGTGVIGSVFGNQPPRGVGGTAGGPRKIAIASGVAAANLLTQVPPVYPPIAKAARISGTVVLHAVIGKDGSVGEVRVVSGNAMLQQAALDAVSKWRYKPYLLNGVPVEVDTTVNVVFNLGVGAPPTAATPQPGTAPAQP